MTSGVWSPDTATAFLLERELFGMRFELDRIEAVLERLGNPHNSFRSIHVVGTNGKSSTTRFCAALLAAENELAGAYLSPHLIGFHERVLLPHGDVLKPATPEVFAAAVQQAASAAEAVEATLAPGDLVTQFELVTAAAFLIFSQSGVTTAAIEAGLGGRLDATNVLRSPKVVVLTSVGLDHTRWLGDDVLSIAAEKLGVLGEGDTLVIPATLPAELDRVAQTHADRCRAQIRRVAPPDAGQLELSALGDFQESNFALACAAVETSLGRLGDQATRKAAQTLVPGRLSIIGESPLTLVDAAHNPQGAVGLARYMGTTFSPNSTTAVVGMLADKDAHGFLDAIIPCVSRLVITQPLNPRALRAEDLASVAAAIGFPQEQLTVISSPHEALETAVKMTAPEGAVIATGSVHLVGDLLSEPGERVVTSL